MRKKTLTLSLILAVLFLCGGASLVYRIFFVRLTRVPTGAMMNTILPGDQLVVNKLLGNPTRGEIVVFEYPGDPARYIARVIGLPGETIQLRGTGIFINGQQLDEERVIVSRRSFESTEHREELSTEGKGRYRVFYGERSSGADENEPGPGNEETIGILGTFPDPQG